MRAAVLASVFLGVSCVAFAQTRVYTNADLDRPLVRTHTATAEELAGLVANQFQLPKNYDGPHAFTAPYDPNWPFLPAVPVFYDGPVWATGNLGYGWPVFSNPVELVRGRSTLTSAVVLSRASRSMAAPRGIPSARSSGASNTAAPIMGGKIRGSPTHR